jgi:hypothetical protein
MSVWGLVFVGFRQDASLVVLVLNAHQVLVVSPLQCLIFTVKSSARQSQSRSLGSLHCCVNTYWHIFTLHRLVNPEQCSGFLLVLLGDSMTQPVVCQLSCPSDPSASTFLIFLCTLVC